MVGRTTVQTGHCMAFWPSAPRLGVRSTPTSLASIMLRMASRSKLWGHLVLVTGSFMGSNVIGHLMLMRSDATARSSSSTRAVWLPADADRCV